MSNSIEKLAKEAERLAKNLQGNPFSVFDRIAKDIQDRQDNAIAMEFTKCIRELLRKNGVTPKITEYTHENVKEHSIEQLYGVTIDELDFSAHDKVFEDKIAKLEKELEEWKEEARVVKKQRDEQLKSFRKGIEPYVDLLHMHETIAELKQRIAELESKETEKPTKINLNDQIKVKLTPLGAEIYYHQYDELNKWIKERGGKQLEPRMPEIDKDGYTKFTLWNFMELYGEHIGMCKPSVISPLYIELCQDEWKMRYNEEPIEKGKE